MPTPERIFDTMNAFQRTEALGAAIDLDLFTAIGAMGATGESVATAKSLGEKLGAAERGVRILCDFLVVTGLLVKNDGRYSLAPDAAVFLDRRSPAYMGTAARFLMSPGLKEAFRVANLSVRTVGDDLLLEGDIEYER